MAHRPSQALSLCSALIAMIALSGYIYHAVALTRIMLYIQMAVHTTICFFLLSIAVFFARPRNTIAGELTGEGSGGVMARRFLPAVFFVSDSSPLDSLAGVTCGIVRCRIRGSNICHRDDHRLRHHGSVQRPRPAHEQRRWTATRCGRCNPQTQC